MAIEMKIGLISFVFTCAALAGAQEVAVPWKFPGPNISSSVDKASGLRFYKLEQGVLAAVAEHDGRAGAVVIMPGPRLSPSDRMRTAAGGIDPDRMLTAMAVGITLPIPESTAEFFVSKEIFGNTLIYRWRAVNGAIVCSQNISFEPWSNKHDVIFIGACPAAQGFPVLTIENGGSTYKGYERYRPRTFLEIIREHSDPKLMQGKEGSMILTGDTFPSKVRTIFTGETRKVSSARKQHLNMLIDSFGVDPKVIALYGKEMLFLEGENKHWLPVNERLLSFLEKELKESDEAVLYVEWVGAKKIDGTWEWIFILQEFQRRLIRD